MEKTALEKYMIKRKKAQKGPSTPAAIVGQNRKNC